ncbi:DUF4265 domain-containing protein [Streptomyces turgidiscabies]|uniref:DUF4265 domain-containing protein n=1 Tax=Streptomyces TaxID=1883 RepID=UPI001F3E3F15|nr:MULTISPECIES: DUF4265 domain-containing protein [Streptomyces]MDX3498075.1 DUF4265 domain-containing protein [Streptomyces turgidiscabies]
MVGPQFIPTGPLGESPQAVHQRFSQFGLGGEVFSGGFPMVAFTVPADVDFAGVRALLARGRRRSGGAAKSTAAPANGGAPDFCGSLPPLCFEPCLPLESAHALDHSLGIRRTLKRPSPDHVLRPRCTDRDEGREGESAA